MTKNLEKYHVIIPVQGVTTIKLETLLNIDLIITDISMPGCDGIAFITQVKEKYTKIPVLFISGFSNELSSENLKDEKISFFAKPFHIDDALRKINDLLITD
jgi:DNA-binding NtrC family response regulator